MSPQYSTKQFYVERPGVGSGSFNLINPRSGPLVVRDVLEGQQGFNTLVSDSTHVPIRSDAENFTQVVECPVVRRQESPYTGVDR